MVTLVEIARLSGVSTATASLVLRNKPLLRPVRPSTIERIRKTAADLHYVPSRIPQALRSKKSNLIGLVVREFCHPLFNQINQALIGELERRGFEVVVTDVPEMSDSKQIEELYRHQVEGLIVGPFYDSAFSPFLQRLADQQFPLVLFLQNPALPADGVTVDSADGACQAVRHLIQQGHNRIACVVSNRSHPKVSGYGRAMKEAGFEVRPEWIIERFGAMEAGADLGRRIEVGDGHPTAYFLHDDEAALGFVGALWRRGIRVPHPIAVVGYGDCPASAHTVISLSTIRLPIARIVSGIVECLLARLENRPLPGWQRQVLNSELVVRESSASGGK